MPSGLLRPHREPKLSNSITIRGCLKVLHDCGLLEPRPEEPKVASPAPDGEDDPSPEGDTDGTKEGDEAAADVPQPPPPDPSYKITMESAYAALLETLLPVGSGPMEPPPPTSRPASPPKLTPPGSAMPPASPLAASLAGEPMIADASSSSNTEQPVEIW